MLSAVLAMGISGAVGVGGAAVHSKRIENAKRGQYRRNGSRLFWKPLGRALWRQWWRSVVVLLGRQSVSVTQLTRLHPLTRLNPLTRLATSWLNSSWIVALGWRMIMVTAMHVAELWVITPVKNANIWFDDDLTMEYKDFTKNNLIK